MPSVHSHITVRDGGVTVSLEFRLWRDKDGRGLIALDPKDEASRQFMIHEREAIKGIMGTKYGLKDVSVYECQGNGSYTPVKDSNYLHNGASISSQQLTEFGNRLQTQGWKQAQDLSSHSLPPPTPHTEWPR